MNILDDVINALDKNYPTYIVGYLYDFIRYRIKACRQYIEGLEKIEGGAHDYRTETWRC
jgi:hypothetical protein